MEADQGLSDLPVGWKLAPFSELGTFARGIAFAKADARRHPEPGYIACLRTTNVQDTIEVEDLLYIPERLVRNDGQRLKAGDLIFSVSNSLALVGKAALASDYCAEQGMTFGAFLAAFRPNAQVHPKWLEYYTRTHRFRNWAKEAASTTTNISNLGTAKILAHIVPVPPYKVQTALIECSEGLFGEIEAGEQELAAAKTDLQRYRRAVLKAAVTGELTREWREQNPSNETGADLLARILKERRARWEDAERAKFAAKGQTPKNDAWKSRYPEPIAPKTDALPKLPDGWAWATMAQVTLLAGGLTVDAKREGDELVEVPYLRVANVQRGALDLSVIKTIRAPQDRINALRLLSNDVLLNEGGDRDKVGRGWVWEGQIPDCIHQNHVFRARPIVPELDGRFISHYCNEVGREYFLRESKQTTNLASLSMSKVASLAIPIPPSAEIAAIVSIAAQALESCEELLGAVRGSAREATSLRQSILAGAFSGKLIAEAAPASNTSKRRHIA